MAVVGERIGGRGEAAEEEEPPQVQWRERNGGLPHFQCVKCVCV